jgi:hypothetical protein
MRSAVREALIGKQHIEIEAYGIGKCEVIPIEIAYNTVKVFESTANTSTACKVMHLYRGDDLAAKCAICRVSTVAKVGVSYGMLISFKAKSHGVKIAKGI